MSVSLKTIIMKVKLKTSFSGPDFVWAIGQEVDLTPAEGNRLIKLDLAEAVNNGTDKPPKLKVYEGDGKEPTVKKQTMSSGRGRRRIIKATIS